MTNTTNGLMFLSIIYSTKDCSVHPKKLKTKSKSKVGAVHGMTEGEKRRISKEMGPITKEILAEEVMKDNL